LSYLTIVGDDAEALRPYAALISDELNVRELRLTDLEAAANGAIGVRQVLQVNARVAGPRLGKDVQVAIKASKSGDWSADADGTVRSGGIPLRAGEYTLQTVVADADPDDQRAVAMLPGGGFVILDTTVTPELAAEGLARDVVRAVQQARRDAGLDVSDRIQLRLSGDENVRAAVQAHADLIKTETLATSLDLSDHSAAMSSAVVGDKQQVGLAVERA
jgi:isoleucyl-tRNA synthetase